MHLGALPRGHQQPYALGSRIPRCRADALGTVLAKALGWIITIDRQYAFYDQAGAFILFNGSAASGDNNGVQAIKSGDVTFNNNTEKQDEMETELLKAFRSMTFIEKLNVMNFVLGNKKID